MQRPRDETEPNDFEKLYTDQVKGRTGRQGSDGACFGSTSGVWDLEMGIINCLVVNEYREVRTQAHTLWAPLWREPRGYSPAQRGPVSHLSLGERESESKI